MRESVMSTKVTSFLKTQNAFVFNVTGNIRQRPGIPDLCIMHNKLQNKVLWLELKVAANKLSAVQLVTIREMKARGQRVYVLRYQQLKGAPPGICWQLEWPTEERGLIHAATSFREIWRRLTDGDDY